jgi:hypothetical protein
MVTFMTDTTVGIRGRPRSIDSMMIAETFSRSKVRMAGIRTHRRPRGGNVLVYLPDLARLVHWFTALLWQRGDHRTRHIFG